MNLQELTIKIAYKVCEWEFYRVGGKINPWERIDLNWNLELKEPGRLRVFGEANKGRVLRFDEIVSIESMSFDSIIDDVSRLLAQMYLKAIEVLRSQNPERDPAYIRPSLKLNYESIKDHLRFSHLETGTVPLVNLYEDKIRDLEMELLSRGWDGGTLDPWFGKFKYRCENDHATMYTIASDSWEVGLCPKCAGRCVKGGVF